MTIKTDETTIILSKLLFLPENSIFKILYFFKNETVLKKFEKLLSDSFDFILNRKQFSKLPDDEDIGDGYILEIEFEEKTKLDLFNYIKKHSHLNTTFILFVNHEITGKKIYQLAGELKYTIKYIGELYYTEYKQLTNQK